MRWEVKSPDGKTIGTGRDFLLLDDNGRITALYTDHRSLHVQRSVTRTSRAIAAAPAGHGVAMLYADETDLGQRPRQAASTRGAIAERLGREFEFDGERLTAFPAGVV